MKRMMVLIAAVMFLIPAGAMAFDLSGWEGGNKDRGQWAWFTGQAQKCDQPIPVPGAHTRAEWEKMLTADTDKLPCGGAGLTQRAMNHIFLFLHTHASDSDDPMNQKPESCG
jgi:hypothetical protein